SRDGPAAAAFAASALPGLGAIVLRARARGRGPERFVHGMLNLVCADPTRVPPELVAAHVAFARERFETMPWADAAFLEAARSLMVTLAWKRRFVASIDSITTPGLILQGA